MQQRAQFYAVHAGTTNRYCLMPYDSHMHFRLMRVQEKHTFYCCTNFEQFFSLTYRLAKLFERLSYKTKMHYKN